MYEAYHNEESLQALLTVIGEDQRNLVVEQTATAILCDPQFSSSDARFLTCVGRTADAETYLLTHDDQLDGDDYTSLLPMAEYMKQEARWLAATVIYRALTESILRRAVSKYYHHGVRYLRNLDVIAAKISDWHAYPDHTEYVDHLRHDHRRKSSFWAAISRIANPIIY